jgi:hypothetical protein
MFVFVRTLWFQFFGSRLIRARDPSQRCPSWPRLEREISELGKACSPLPCLDCALPAWTPTRIVELATQSSGVAGKMQLCSTWRAQSLALHPRKWLPFVGRNLMAVGCFGLPHPTGDVIEPVVGELSKDRPTQVAWSLVCEPRPLIAELALALHGPRMHVGSRVAAVVAARGGGIPCCIRKSGRGAAQLAMWW